MNQPLAETHDVAATSTNPAGKPRPAPPQEAVQGDFRVALCQMEPVLGDRARNLKRHQELIAQARRQGADLIVFPELSLTGYCLRDMVPEVALFAESGELAQLVSDAGDSALVLGFVEESHGHLFYNTGLFAEGGRIQHLHRKVYLPTYGLFDELRYFAAGKRLTAFDSPRLGRVGLLVCEDFWHLSAIAIMQAEEVDLLICIANSPARGVDQDQIRIAQRYERLCRTYAECLGASVLFVNRVGFEDGLCFWGGSMAVGPDGEIVARAPYFDESLIMGTFDRAQLRRQRLATPLNRDERLLLTLEELGRIKRRRYEG
jgi:predicted amidohydrolase